MQIKFYIQLIILAALSILTIQFSLSDEILKSHLTGVSIFYTLLTALIYFISEFATKRSSAKNSLTIIMGTLVFRLLASIFALVIYYVFFGKPSILFVSGFFVLYLLFTVFEIYHLVTNLRPDSKQDSSGEKYRK